MNADLFSMLVTQVGQVTLLAVVVWLFTFACCKNRPHLSHALWVLVLLKCITPPVFTSPTSVYGWLRSSPSNVESTAIETPSFQPETISPPASPPQKFAPVEIASDAPAMRVDFPAAPPITGSSSPAFAVPLTFEPITLPQSSPGSVSWNWKIWLVATWLIVATILMLATLSKIVRFTIWLGKRNTIAAPELEEFSGRIASQLGIRRHVRIRVIEANVGPAVTGLFRPTVLLPAFLVDGKPTLEIEPIIAHELIHIRRGDLVWSWLQLAATRLFWFHPLVWLASRNVTVESEKCCDEETIANLNCDVAVYARGLIEVLESKHRLRTAPATPGVRAVDITTDRLERIMKLRNGIQQRTPIWVWALILVAAAAVLPGSETALGQQEVKEPTSKTEEKTQKKTEKKFEFPEIANTTIASDISVPDAGLVRRGQRQLQPVAQPFQKTQLGTPDRQLKIDNKTELGSIDSKDRSAKIAGKGHSALVDKSGFGQVLPPANFFAEPPLPTKTDEMVGTVNFDIHEIQSAIQSTDQASNIDKAMLDWLNETVQENNELADFGELSPTVRVEKTKLSVTATVENVHRCSSVLTQIRKLFKTQVIVETAFAPRNLASRFEADFEWEMATPKHGVSQERDFPDATEKLLSNSDWTVQAVFERDFKEPFDGVERVSYIHQRAPLLFAMVDSDLATKFRNAVEARVPGDMNPRPNAIAFDGEFASISDRSKRPFVTAVKKIKTGNKVAIQPVIEVLDAGTLVSFRPKVKTNGVVKLDCIVNFSMLNSVTTSQLPITGASGGEVSVQNPNSTETKIRFSKEIPADKTLVVLSIGPNENGQQERMYSFFHCRVVQPSGLSLENVLAAKSACKSKWKAQAEQLEQQRAKALKRKLEAEKASKTKSVWLIQHLDSTESGSRMTLDLPDNMSVHVLGNFDQEVSSKQVRICGPQMKLELASIDPTGKAVANEPGNDQFTFSADYGEFISDRTSTESFQLNFQGNAKLSQNGLNVTAQLIEFSNGKLMAQGEVKLEYPDQTVVESMQLELDFENGAMKIEGRAKMTRPAGESGIPMIIKSDLITWNFETGEIKTQPKD